MAFYRKLTEGWRLCDGILSESVLAEPCGVYEALREAGHVPDAAQGMNALACEWIAGREWTYSLNFETPGEDDERILLELPCVAGKGEAHLNGEKLAEFEAGAVRLDLTGAIRAEGENELNIRFAPMMHVRPAMGVVPKIGLMCAPVLRAVNFATVENVSLSSRTEGEDGVITARFAVNAHVSGKYLFRYAVSLDGDAAGMFEYTERLPAAKRTIRHEIRIPQAVKMDASRLEETIYGIKFTLERGGVGCDVRHMETAFRPESAGARALSVLQWPVSEDMIDRLTAMGADGIVLAGMPKNAFERNDFLSGLTVVEGRAYTANAGMVREETLKGYAGEEEYWPCSNALWRLRGGMKISPAAGEADAFAKVMRFVQASDTAARAEMCRKDQGRMIAQADEDFAYFVSHAVMEADGSVRPAADALKEAWKEHIAFCELPASGRCGCGESVQMNVWALVEGLRGHVLTVKTRVMDMEGNELDSITFPVMGGDVRLAGVMNFRSPEDAGIVIVRTELIEADGSVIDRRDGVLAAGSGDRIALLADAPEAMVTKKGASVRNVSSAAALSAGLCLMPGESSDQTGREWMNA